MNKKTLVLCACLAMVFASTAMAQSVIWCDVRANSIATNPGTNANLNAITGGLAANQPFLFDNVNGGRKGGGQTLYLEPVRFTAGVTHTDFPHVVPQRGGHQYAQRSGYGRRPQRWRHLGLHGCQR